MYADPGDFSDQANNRLFCSDLPFSPDNHKRDMAFSYPGIIKRNGGGGNTYVFRYTSLKFSGPLIAMGLFLGWKAMDADLSPHEFHGRLIAAIASAVFAAAVYERDSFIFDPVQKLITWKTYRFPFQACSGSLRYEEVSKVTVETEPGKFPSIKGTVYRVALSSDFQGIPLTACYLPGRESAQRTCNAIQELLQR
ncbi:MAG TPA: hypothetical protein VHY22_08710 [Chthoniobacteraceae bacterium]|jgi:hypothetical protein|nr:hypothetical protein [Chthoniobacteraceae bacterium]